MHEPCVKCFKFCPDQNCYRWPCGHIHCNNCQNTLFKTVYDANTRQNKTVQTFTCQECPKSAAKEDETKKRISNLENQVKQQSENNAALTKKLDTLSMNFSRIEGILQQITESKKEHPKETSNQKISVVYENQTPSQFTYQLVGELDSLVKTMKNSLDTK